MRDHPHRQTDELIERFEALWRSGGPIELEAIERLLVGIDDAPQRRAALTELIAVDLEYRWRTAGDSPPTRDDGAPCSALLLEDYVRRWPELGPLADAPLMLLAEEYRARLRWGDAPDIASYAARCQNPQLAAALEQVRREVSREAPIQEPAEHPELACETTPPAASVNLAADLATVPDAPPSTVDSGPVQRDDRLADWGDYQLLSVLGEGGMGTVYRAYHAATDRHVALKVIRPDLFPPLKSRERSETIDRFQQEVRAAARLEHDHIVRVYEAGQWRSRPYFSMQYVSGTDLDARLRGGPLSDREAAETLEPVCRAIEAAHRQGVIHRDIKPQNILLDESGRPYVSDFGLAKCLEGDFVHTHTGSILGTPPYMSPEQAQGLPTDHRTDVYSLGATLYQTLAGRPPFRAATAAETLQQVVHDEPVSPRRLNPTISRDLETICLKCLEKQPPRRYATAADLAEELARFLDGVPIHARPVSSFGRGLRWCRRNPVLAGSGTLITLLILLLGAGALIFAVRTREHAQSLAAALGKTEAQRLRAVAGESEARAKTREAQAAERRARQAEQDATAARDASEQSLLLAESRLLANQVASAQRAWDVADMPAFFRHLDEAAPGWERGQLADMTTWENQPIKVADCTGVAALSPDGRRLAAATTGGNVLLWSTESNELIETIALDGSGAGERPLGAVQRLQFDPDGAQLAIGLETRLVVWDLAAKSKVLETTGNGNRQLAFSGDGDAIAVDGPNRRGRVTVYELPSGEPRFRCDAPNFAQLVGLALLPDEKGLVTVNLDPGSGGTIRLWDAHNGELKATLPRQRPLRQATCFAIDAEGERLAIGDRSGVIDLWSLGQQSHLRELRGHVDRTIMNGDDARIVSLAFSRDGDRLVSGSNDQTLRVWSVHTGEELLVLKGHRGGVSFVAFNGDGKQLVSGASDGAFRRWSGQPQQPMQLDAHERSVHSIDVHPPTGLLLTSGGDFMMKTWGLESLEPRMTFSRGATLLDVSQAVFDPTGERIIAGERGGAVSVWDAASGRKSSGGGSQLAWLKLVAGKLTGRGDYGKVLKTIAASSREVKEVAVSPDGEWAAVVCGDDKEVRSWRLETGEPGMKLSYPPNTMTESEREQYEQEFRRRIDDNDAIGWAEPFSNRLNAVAFSPAGRLLAAGGADGQVVVWDFASGRVKHVLRGHEGGISSVRFHPDGRRLISADGRGVARIWDVQSGASLLELRGHTEGVRAMALHRDGEYLATAGAQTVKIWRLETGQATLSLRCPPKDRLSASLNFVLSLTFTPEGDRLLAGMADGRILVWRRRD
ncbi:MAG: protein kinase [Pirellulaceae bacterium]